MKLYLRIAALLLALLSGLSNLHAQAPCNISTGIFPSPTVCIGTPVTLSAFATGINIGSGANGPLTVAGGATVFTDGTVTAVAGGIATIGSNSIAVASAAGFSVGDEILIITMQHAATSGNTVGRHEFRTITSVSANTLFLNQGLSNSYVATGTLKHQVIEVPNYSNVTINTNGLLTCAAWNGTVGGVLCFRANGTVLVNSGGSINANGKGYRGVAQRAAICRNADGGQGEGIYGTGVGSGACNGSTGNNSGSWLAANGNGGGGGTGTGDSGGGGGGGYASAGAAGGNNNNPGGAGGVAVGNSSLSVLIMGGAGGEGGADEDGGAPGAGGNGGGIVLFAANTLSLAGTVGSNGNIGGNAIPSSGCGMASGGGGAGGSIQLFLISSSVSGGSITANGGTFGQTYGCGVTGGTGSNGRVRIDAPGTIPVTSPVAFQGGGTALSNITYTWSTNANTSSISVSPSATTIYTISVSATGCSSSSSVVAVNVLALPTVAVNSGTLCPGQAFTLSANGASSYSWAGNQLLAAPSATGGVITKSNGYVIHTFTAGGIFTSASSRTVEVLTVAGGGGSGNANGAAGGGGGGVLQGTAAIGQQSYAIVVGNGGAGAASGRGLNGQNSIAFTYTAIGGGGSGSEISGLRSGSAGGSGGGSVRGNNGLTSGAAGTPGQGSAGGLNVNDGGPHYSGGGGGGAGAPGGNGGAAIVGGAGGNGIQSAISGTNTYYGGGGGGASYNNGIGLASCGPGGLGGGAMGGTNPFDGRGRNGSPNTGGGGGGHGLYNFAGGNGGSGVVIIRYIDPATTSTAIVSPSVTTIYTVTGTDTFGCISAPATTTVGVGPLITVNSGSICSGQSFTLTPSGATSFTVQGGSMVVNPGVTSTYTVSGSNPGCSSNSFITATVSVLASPVISISGNTTACLGGTVVLTANGANSYTWSTGANTSSIAVSPSVNSTYSVVATSSAGCSATSNPMTVTVTQLTAQITGATTVCAGSPVTLVPMLSSGLGTTPVSVTFTNTGAGTWTVPAGVTSISVTVVGGGGGGGGDIGGGGGGGQVINLNNYSVAPGQVLSMNIAAQSGYPSSYNFFGQNGGSSSLSGGLGGTVIALGGNGGRGRSAGGAGSNVGWNGGGGSYDYLSGNAGNGGFAGGNAVFYSSAGGGGGSGGPGQNATSTTPGFGGNGVQSIINGVFYGGGGGGASYPGTVYGLGTHGGGNGGIQGPVYGQDALPNRGSGGGGGPSHGSGPNAGRGSSGIIIVAFTAAPLPNGTFTWSTGANTPSITINPSVTSSYSVAFTTTEGCRGTTTLTTVNVNPSPTITTNSGVICAGQSFTINPSGANTYTVQGANAIVSPSLTSSYTVAGTNTLTGCVSQVFATSTVTVNVNPTVTVNSGSICAGQSFTLNPGGATTYTVQGGNTVVSPGMSSTYTVIGSSAGCLSNGFVTASVAVFASPVIGIAGSNTLCAGESIVLSANGASTYTWNGGSNASTLSVAPTSNTSYTVNGTSAAGCSGNSATLAVSVNTLPVVAITGTNAVCAGGTIVLTANGASSYTWNGGSSASTLSTSPAGKSTYSLTGTSPAGCKGNTATLAVTVNTLPIIAITGTNALCAGGTISLTATGANTYTWSGGSNATTFVASPISNTVYTLSGTSAEGCFGNTATLAVTVNNLPVVAISGTNALCAGGTIILAANGASTYTWSGGSNASTLSIAPTSNATYSLNGTNSAGCAGNTATLAVSVNTLPVIAITGTNAVCAGATVNLTANGAATYTWTGGANTAALAVSPLSNTSYTVSGRSAAGCLGNTATLAVTVNTLPLVAISGTNAVCAGGTITLIASGANTYTWTGGSNASTFTATPNSNTTYSLSGTNAAGCLGNTATLAVTANTLPVVVITGTNAVCAGGIVTLTATGANTYTWNTGANTSTISAAPTSSMAYVVSARSAVGCLGNTAVLAVTVNSLPIVVISGATGICAGQNASFTASGANTYSWSTGGINASIVTTPSANTTYTVRGVDALGCSNTATQLVTVQLSLSVSITGPSVICEGQTANLSGLGGVTYTWNTGASTSTISPTLSNTTTFSVIGASGSCSDTAVKTVSVVPNPTVSITATTAICAGSSETLTASGATTYSWSNGSTGSTAIVTPSASAVYTVVGSYSTGCANTAVTSMMVYTLPIISISGQSVICAGDSISLVANGASSYVWNTNAATQSITVSPAASTSYSAVGTDTNGCSGTSAQTTVIVNPTPTVISIPSASIICAGDSVSIQASGALSYNWSTGSADSTVIVKPTSNASYTVTGTNSYSCSSNAITTVTVNALPSLLIAGNSTICLGEETIFTVSGANTYSWSNGAITASTLLTPSVNTSYTASGTSAEGCIGTSTVTVTVDNCTGIKEVTATTAAIKVYPNPNNGFFVIELVNSRDAHIYITNVLGQTILSQHAELFNQMDISAFDKGLYFINVTQNNKSVYRTNVVIE